MTVDIKNKHRTHISSRRSFARSPGNKPSLRRFNRKNKDNPDTALKRRARKGPFPSSRSLIRNEGPLIPSHKAEPVETKSEETAIIDIEVPPEPMPVLSHTEAEYQDALSRVERLEEELALARLKAHQHQLAEAELRQQKSALEERFSSLDGFVENLSERLRRTCESQTQLRDEVLNLRAVKNRLERQVFRDQNQLEELEGERRALKRSLRQAQEQVKLWRVKADEALTESAARCLHKEAQLETLAETLNKRERVLELQQALHSQAVLEAETKALVATEEKSESIDQAKVEEKLHSTTALIRKSHKALQKHIRSVRDRLDQVEQRDQNVASMVEGQQRNLERLQDQLGAFLIRLPEVLAQAKPRPAPVAVVPSPAPVVRKATPQVTNHAPASPAPAPRSDASEAKPLMWAAKGIKRNPRKRR